jgi:hypothetical protein
VQLRKSTDHEAPHYEVSSTGEWRKLYNVELHNLYSSPNVVRVMRWARHIARIGEGKGEYWVLMGNPEEKRPSEDQGVNGRIVLRRIFRK